MTEKDFRPGLKYQRVHTPVTLEILFGTKRVVTCPFPQDISTSNTLFKIISFLTYFFGSQDS